MEQNFWIKKWQDGEIAFHQSQFHPMLVKHAHLLPLGTVMVPLCGKTLDMIYLANLGHQVIGVELSPIACQDFFKENGIEFIEEIFGGFKIYRSPKITLWSGDFFEFPQSEWEKITAIYDRAALIALPPDMRERYAQLISQKTHQLHVLLITMTYPQEALQGPPFSVSDLEIKKIYPAFNMVELELMVDERISRDNPRFQTIEVREAIYHLQK